MAWIREQRTLREMARLLQRSRYYRPMRIALAALLTSAFATLLYAQQAGAPSAKVDENILFATVDGVALHLDAFEPPAGTGGNHAAVVLIHGGTWSSLDKSTMRGMGEFLSRHGFVAFAVDYRLYHNGQNRWPAQLDDVQRAVRWVRANAARYGVNPDRIGAFGHSAGGQLAALLGMEDTRDNSDAALAKFSSRVQAVVDVSGPVDFTRDHDSDGDTFLARFLGASYQQKPELWREASPVFLVAHGDAPFLIVHGTEDGNVPMAQSEELLQKLQDAGVPATLIKVEDGHTFHTPQARLQLALQTLAFFNRYLIAAQ